MTLNILKPQVKSYELVLRTNLDDVSKINKHGPPPSSNPLSKIKNPELFRHSFFLVFKKIPSIPNFAL